ncbi:hypothetical protein BDV12DRAFT_201728 [Aspergillus spectabilis]
MTFNLQRVFYNSPGFSSNSNMRPLTFTSVLALCAFVASAYPTTDNSRDADVHDATDLTREVSPSPDAPPVIFNGTVDKVYDRFREINPNYENDWEDAAPASTPLEYTKTNIEWIRMMDTKPIRPGGKCQRVRCMQNSAITWCNFDRKSKTLLSFDNIADGAQVIINNCAKDGGVGGVHWHNDLWAVFVKKEVCYPVKGKGSN